MIAFRCICGEPMEVPAEMAGEPIQCPVCRRLVDVPTLNDADAFNDDGTVKMGDAVVVPSGLGGKFEAFSGQVDMRPAIEDFLLAGESSQPTERAVPRYDPVTGELILPVGIANDELPPVPAIDINAPVLGYARTVPQGPSVVAPDKVTWWNLPWRMFAGTNWAAIIAVLVAHVLLYLPMLMPGFNILWLPITLTVLLMVISHYANTIEEFGPADMERVPVLLRSADIGEDVLRPLYFVGVAGFLAFLPLLAMTMFGPEHVFRDHAWVLYALVAWGMLTFPVLVFTTVCGGTLHNLWPHRVASAFVAAPARMTMAMVAFWLAISAYVVASYFVEIGNPSNFQNPLPTFGEFMKFLAGMGATFVAGAAAVYLMHLAAAWLGLIYRDHHNDLNWVLQRHDRVYGPDTMAELMRRRGKPVVNTVDPRRPEIDHANAKPALPLNRKHHGFEVKF